MKRGGWLELVGAVEGVGISVRMAITMLSSLLPASSSVRKGSSDGFARGGRMTCFSRVSRSYSSTTRNSTCAMLPASMIRRRGVQVRILSERKPVDAKACAVMAMVNRVAPRHHVCTDSHLTTRMMTTGMWTRRITML